MRISPLEARAIASAFRTIPTLVHDAAKPIGCTAWNAGRDFSKAGWKAFEERDRLNDRLYGPHWKLRVIPMWLKRVLRKQLNRKQ
jgi:hypothetical protein